MRRTESAMARTVGDEIVILNPTTGKYFGLNHVGAVIWECLAEDCSIQDLIDAVRSSYDVPADQAKQDVNDLIDQFSAAELIDS